MYIHALIDKHVFTLWHNHKLLVHLVALRFWFGLEYKSFSLVVVVELKFMYLPVN